MINKEPRAMFAIGGDDWPGIAKLAEECGEVVQVIGKLMGTGGRTDHWDGTDLREKLIEEIGDLMAACVFVGLENGIAGESQARAANKLEIFYEWRNPNRCNIASEQTSFNFYCTREPEHGGTCAAVPV